MYIAKSTNAWPYVVTFLPDKASLNQHRPYLDVTCVNIVGCGMYHLPFLAAASYGQLDTNHSDKISSAIVEPDLCFFPRLDLDQDFKLLLIQL